MIIKGILFDKDGTLLEFDKTWRPVASEVINRIVSHYKLDSSYKKKLSEAIGLFDNHIDSNSSLSSGTNRDVALDFFFACPQIENEDEFISWSTNTFNEVANIFPFYTVDGAKETIKNLKENGIVIGLSTADSVANANIFLEKSGLLPYFDFIGADDGIINPKPATDYMDNFCKEFSLKPSEVMVVGDTLTDMDFGINSGAGIKLGVLTGTSSKKILTTKADLVTNSIKDIIKNNKFIWEDL